MCIEALSSNRKIFISMDTKDNKIDPTLIVNNSAIRAAIPILPIPVAMMCFVFNVFIPGSGQLF